MLDADWLADVRAWASRNFDDLSSLTICSDYKQHLMCGLSLDFIFASILDYFGLNSGLSHGFNSAYFAQESILWIFVNISEF